MEIINLHAVAHRRRRRVIVELLRGLWRRTAGKNVFVRAKYIFHIKYTRSEWNEEKKTQRLIWTHSFALISGVEPTNK